MAMVDMANLTVEQKAAIFDALVAEVKGKGKQFGWCLAERKTRIPFSYMDTMDEMETDRLPVYEWRFQCVGVDDFASACAALLIKKPSGE